VFKSTKKIKQLLKHLLGSFSKISLATIINCIQKHHFQATCVHIVRILMDKYKVLDTDVLLAQVALTEDELSRINQVYENNQDNLEQETSSVHHDQHDQSTLMHEEIASIFEGHPDAADPQRWYVEKSLTKRKARCCAPTCNATFPPGKITIFCQGLYIPPNCNFAKKRTFYYCALGACVRQEPIMGNLKVPPNHLVVCKHSGLSQADLTLLKNRGFKLEE
jgi:hypothetical protein